jgi:hypothetical protein
MVSAYFAPLVNLPVIINGPGRYITRGGELVKVEVASWRNDFGCTQEWKARTISFAHFNLFK